jgi:hypothetical protein
LATTSRRDSSGHAEPLAAADAKFETPIHLHGARVTHPIADAHPPGLPYAYLAAPISTMSFAVRTGARMGLKSSTLGQQVHSSSGSVPKRSEAGRCPVNGAGETEVGAL